MKLSELKTVLKEVDTLQFLLPNGKIIPRHFHITEIGLMTKSFIDCGGTSRVEKNASFQLWCADDLDHRLTPYKFLGIIKKGEPLFEGDDLPVEVEYQGSTVGRYGLEFMNNTFILAPKFTDCLAREKCGVPETELQTVEESNCEPGSGCC